MKEQKSVIRKSYERGVKNGKIEAYKKAIASISAFALICITMLSFVQSKFGKDVVLPTGASKTYVEYKVKDGDNLHSIAAKMIAKYNMEDIYSTDDLTRELADLNNCYDHMWSGITIKCPVVYYEDNMSSYKE